jgi:hypothetical protein
MIIRLAMASYHSKNYDKFAPSILSVLSVSKSWNRYALPQFYRSIILSRGSAYHRFAKLVRSELGLSHRKYVMEVVFDLREGIDRDGDKRTLTSNVIQAILQACRRVRTIAVLLNRQRLGSLGVWWLHVLGKSEPCAGAPSVIPSDHTSQLKISRFSRSMASGPGLLNLLTT